MFFLTLLCSQSPDLDKYSSWFPPAAQANACAATQQALLVAARAVFFCRTSSSGLVNRERAVPSGLRCDSFAATVVGSISIDHALVSLRQGHTAVGQPYLYCVEEQ